MMWHFAHKWTRFASNGALHSSPVVKKYQCILFKYPFKDKKHVHTKQMILVIRIMHLSYQVDLNNRLQSANLDFNVLVLVCNL
jgi:hypothetical protein